MIYGDFFQPSLQLQSTRVIMRNMQPNDIDGLWALSQVPGLWTWFNRRLDNRPQLEAWMEEAFVQQQQQLRFPFVVIDRLNGSLAGSTSFGNISFPDKRIEIGWTWYGEAYRGTGINTHCKFLLLQYAFETLHFERVEIKTDALNERSRAAIRKLGMTEEGILRSHMAMPGERRRDSVYYSLLKSEWLLAKEKLLSRL
ncbi:GNAT family N-acetyltransferase [Flavihumibacter profundi]|jgi:N-acetyltransferase|uniref:GNAT family N-acetyltransferase n=1 Tax=Flavihumibacter profundi TaxID=2716883 RepID=UPI001CC70825|nr:GNAT family protein [Flavihumibacter profundi]MBZ5858924.1 GNAT family N-acetyltransferase [Flavihumibacter profundi]